jgi:hypothetical protein
MIVYKSVKETNKEYAHINVYFNETYMGYIMRDFKAPITKWVFTSKNSKISYFRGERLEDIKDTLSKIYNKIPVKLMLHFGMTQYNYVMTD